MTKDDVAQARYGTTYARLSAFGKRDIDRAFQEPVYAATLDSKYDDPTPRIAKLVEELESTKQENLELWDELSELKAELEEIRSKYNPPLSS